MKICENCALTFEDSKKYCYQCGGSLIPVESEIESELLPKKRYQVKSTWEMPEPTEDETDSRRFQPAAEPDVPTVDRMESVENRFMPKPEKEASRVEHVLPKPERISPRKVGAKPKTEVPVLVAEEVSEIPPVVESVVNLEQDPELVRDEESDAEPDDMRIFTRYRPKPQLVESEVKSAAEQTEKSDESISKSEKTEGPDFQKKDQPQRSPVHLTRPQIASIQPKLPAAAIEPTFENAEDFLKTNQLERAIGIFTLLYNEGHRDEATVLYTGIGKALEGDYSTALILLETLLENSNPDLRTVAINRNYLYMAYCLSQCTASVSEIKGLMSRIDFQLLYEKRNPVDERSHVKVTEYLVNRSLRTINRPVAVKEQITEIVNTYMCNTCFSEKSDVRIADMWYNIGNRYAKFDLYTDALNAYQEAGFLNPDEAKYQRKVNDMQKILLELSNRKKRTFFTVVGSLVLALILGSAGYLFRDELKRRTMDLLYQTDVIKSDEKLVKDLDGNLYHPVRIGTQIWLVENLKTTRFQNGEPIRYVSDNAAWGKLTSSAFSYFNNDESKSVAYGALYNWYAVNDSRNIAPKGWHVATEKEWEVLIRYLGGPEVAGGKLKEAGIEHWESPNTKASNSSGFTALPGGSFRQAESYNAMGYVGSFWCAPLETDSVQKQAKSVEIGFSTETAIQLQQDLKVGLSVRCVKN